MKLRGGDKGNTRLGFFFFCAACARYMKSLPVSLLRESSNGFFVLGRTHKGAADGASSSVITCALKGTYVLGLCRRIMPPHLRFDNSNYLCYRKCHVFACRVAQHSIFSFSHTLSHSACTVAVKIFTTCSSACVNNSLPTRTVRSFRHFTEKESTCPRV